MAKNVEEKQLLHYGNERKHSQRFLFHKADVFLFSKNKVHFDIIVYFQCSFLFVLLSPHFCFKPPPPICLLSGALSPIFLCPTLLPSSLRLVSYWLGRGESQRTCLFINITEGSHQGRKKSSTGVMGRGKG